MKNDRSPQQRMDAAFDNYFALSKILREDMNGLLNDENDTQSWRRNFIRASAALIEGYAHCLREMCAVSFECVAPKIAKDEVKVLKSEQGLDANDRVKFTLRAAYKLFELETAPNFAGKEWLKAQRVLSKRHQLMHPKTSTDLDIPDELWEEIRHDVTWLLEQLFNVFSLLQQKHGG